MSCIAQELYGGCVAVPDPVRATSLSQQQLLAKQIQTTKEQAKLGTNTKAIRIRTEGKFFRTVTPKILESDE